jgi:hypothetical protein
MTPTPSAELQAAAVEMIRRICPPPLERDAYGHLLAGHFAAHLVAVLREAADYADTLRQFDRASGTRKAAQISENVGILRVADALRHMADEVQQAAPALTDDQRTTADLLAASATEYRVPVPENGGTNLIARRQGAAFGTGWSVVVPGWGGGRAWTTEGWQESISALSVDRLFCWPDAATAVDEARRALAMPEEPGR